MDAFPFSIAPVIAPAPLRLVPLEPSALGTALQESLPSHLARLALAHCVPVPALLSREIIPAIAGASHLPVSNFLRHYSRLLLAGDGQAKKVATRVGALTGSDAVLKLVHPHLSSFVGWTRDLRARPAWCTLCLSDWRQAGRPPFFPLLWAIREVRCCVEHQVSLEESCPSCGRPSWHLDGSSQLGAAGGLNPA